MVLCPVGLLGEETQPRRRPWQGAETLPGGDGIESPACSGSIPLTSYFSSHKAWSWKNSPQTQLPFYDESCRRASPRESLERVGGTQK